MAICKCGERKKPISSREWEIATYMGFADNWGLFRKPSKTSEVICNSCRAAWRTKAKYVDLIKHRDKDKTL